MRIAEKMKGKSSGRMTRRRILKRPLVKERAISRVSASSDFTPSHKLIIENGKRIATSTNMTLVVLTPNQITASIAQPSDGKALRIGIRRLATSRRSGLKYHPAPTMTPEISKLSATDATTRNSDV